MESISIAFAREHQHCDRLFAAVEEEVARGQWTRAGETYSEFVRALEDHLRKEEETLFPAIEERTGMRAGPTEVMRREHTMMRDLLRQMEQEIARKNGVRYLGLSETLQVLIQQHNIKEEQILYRLADEVLAGEHTQLLAQPDGGDTEHA